MSASVSVAGASNAVQCTAFAPALPAALNVAVEIGFVRLSLENIQELPGVG
jgi:hypothetical protein